MSNSQYPYKLYTPVVREPLPLRRKPYILPAPPEMPDKPQKIDWLRTLLPPFIMLVVLGIVSSVIQARSFFFYTMIMMGVYPMARVGAYLVQKQHYDKKEKERAALYAHELELADREILTYIRKQRDFLKGEYLPTERVCNLAEAEGERRTLWHRTNSAHDFLGLRIGIYDGQPSFPIEVPKGDEIERKDPLLAEAHKLVRKFKQVEKLPYLLNLKDLGSVAIMAEEEMRYGMARRLLLDVLVHHRPDEVEVYILSNHREAVRRWGWLRWAPHCRVFDEEKEFEHLIFGSQAVKIFLGRFESYINKNQHLTHQVLVIDVDGIQQYDDEFIHSLNANTQEWNLSLIFVGGAQVPRSVRGVLKLKNLETCLFIDTRISTKDKDEKEYHTLVELDPLPGYRECDRVTRALSRVKLLSSTGDMLLSQNVSLFDVLGLGKADKLTYNHVMKNWCEGSEDKIKVIKDDELLQFPIGLTEENSQLLPCVLNLLEAGLGGKDAYHTMLIGTTGSGKSEFIKSLILAAAYKYPPQYLNFFCMDFKGGSTVEELKDLPHVNGVMNNLDEVSAQRGLISISYEIERRQKEFTREAEQRKGEVKDIWQYNNGKAPRDRMPHLLLILDEFTRGLDLLSTPDYNLQDVLEKQLVPQGRSLGIFLILANQVANSKAMKLLPNIGWRIALRVASKDQMSFIATGLKPPKFAGRGYIQAIGEDPIEFQSGYSGKYVQYEDLLIKPKSICIKELLPNGIVRSLNSNDGSSSEVREKEQERSDSEYLEMRQMMRAIKTTADHLALQKARRMYQKPLPRRITLDQTDFEDRRYRTFDSMSWSERVSEKNFLKATVGFVDFVQECEQKPLVIDFREKNPHLLLVGTQSNVNEGLRSILFPLLITHSPDDIHFYMLEFGKGLQDLPKYPHIGNIITQRESERIARAVNYLEAEFSKREEAFRSINEEVVNCYPHLFLVINNFAGLTEYIDQYQKVMRLVLQESHKYGIHVILMVLPRGTGTRVQSSDLKAVKSRIVFPSINHEDYWHYLDVGERKLVKLTGMDASLNEKEEMFPSRAHWLCTSDSRFDRSLEMQLALPNYKDKTDKEYVSHMNYECDCASPFKIEVLEDKYNLKALPKPHRDIFQVGMRWLDLKEITVQFNELPCTLGVSGPRSSGKTNFLISFLDQAFFDNPPTRIDVFSVFSNQLTEYCVKREYPTFVGQKNILNRLSEIDKENFENPSQKHLIVFDDANLFWEINSEENDEIKNILDSISGKTYGKTNIRILVSFNYTPPFKVAMSRNGLLRSIHDNKTGLCLAYEGDWLIGSIDLANYKKKLNDVPPPGRGVFVLNGKETEVQTFWYEIG